MTIALSFAAIETRARDKSDARREAWEQRRSREAIGIVPEHVKHTHGVGPCKHWRRGITRYKCDLCNPPPAPDRISTTYGWAGSTVDHGPAPSDPSGVRPHREGSPPGGWSPYPEGRSPTRGRLWALARGLRRRVADPASAPVARCLCGARYDGAGFLELAQVPRAGDADELRACRCARVLSVPRNRLEGAYPLSRPRIAACRYARTGSGGVTLKLEPIEGRPYFSGLQHCGSVWECPTCAAKICAGRAEQLETLLERHGRDRALFVTLTVRHGLGDDLRDLSARLSAAYRAFCRGQPYRRFCERWGIVGTVRAIELTHGNRNGWHPHLHLLWFLRDPIRRDEVLSFEDSDGRNRLRYCPDQTDSLETLDTTEAGNVRLAESVRLSADLAFIFDRWSTMVARYIDPQFRCPGCKWDMTGGELDALACGECNGNPGLCQAKRCPSTLRACRCGLAFDPELNASPRRGANLPDVEHGFDVVPIASARYLAKMGLELAELTGKIATGKNRSPWQIASDLNDRPTRTDAALWRDYCGAMKGRRKLTFSRGLLRRYGIADLEDEDMAADETPDDAPARTICELAPDFWDAARHLADEHGIPLPALMLDAACAGGAPAVMALARKHVQEHGAGRIAPPRVPILHSVEHPIDEPKLRGDAMSDVP